MATVPGLIARIIQAESRLRPFISETPLLPSVALSTDVEVYLKLETLQPTGSFKLRGASHKLLCLQDEQQHTVVTASSGNHGAATAYAARRLGMKVIVFVPEQASTSKTAAIEHLGAELRVYGDDGVKTERFARAYALEHQLPYISPYNDLDVIAGQGSVGLELIRQCPDLDAVFMAVGGGGLIAGTAAALKASQPAIKVIACSPENSAVMIHALQAGVLRDLPSTPTLSDGTAGGVEEDAVTFGLCQQLVDDHVLVTEAEITSSLKHCLASEHLLVEGAAAVALAAFEKTRSAYQGKKVAIVLCGANISLDDLKQVLAA